MARLAALEINNEEARVIAVDANGTSLTLTHFYRFQLDEEFPADLNSALIDVDSSVAQINSSQIIYREIELPFNDKKKIERTAPLQLQDQLPIDIDDFTLDSIILDHAEKGRYKILTSAAPSDSIAKTLELSNKLGLDPKLITTKACALIALKSFFPEELSGSFAIIEAGSSNISLAIFAEDKLIFLREISSKNLVSQSTYTEILCCLEKFHVESINYLGAGNILAELRNRLPQKITELDLSKFVINKSSEDLNIENISWAIGLLSTEMSSQKSVIDFRVGDFAGRHLFKNIVTALREEAVFICLAILCAILWIGSQYYRVSSGLNRIDTRISEIAKSALPDETVPKRNELETLESKLVELEEQLSGMGSLSSLSPLESLLELSKTIAGDIQIDIDTLNIAESKITFRGTVLDNPTVGRLSTALENDAKVFCTVKVDPAGRVPGSSRVRFSAEIDLCE